MGRESKFVKERVKPDLKRIFPDGMLIKQDPNTSFQGVPDYLFLNEDKWAALETKASSSAKVQDNQPYYIEKLGAMSFSAFASPENWDEVLSGLIEAFNK